MTEINEDTPCIGGGWRGVRDALAKRDRWHKFLTKGHPDGVMVPYDAGSYVRYYWVDLKRESEPTIPWGTWKKTFDDYREFIPERLRPEPPKRSKAQRGRAKPTD